MNVNISLSGNQAKAVRAISQMARLSEEKVLVGCAIVAMNMLWDTPEELVEDMRAALDPDNGVHIRNGKLPCGLYVETVPGIDLQIFSQRVIEAQCRRIAKLFREDPNAAGMTYDPRTGTIHVKDGPAYRFTGKRIVAVEN